MSCSTACVALLPAHPATHTQAGPRSQPCSMCPHFLASSALPCRRLHDAPPPPGAVILIAADSLRPAGSAGVAGDAQGPASGAEARAGGGRGRGRGRRGGGRPGRDGRGGGSGGSSTHSPLMAHVARYTLSDVHNLNVMRLEVGGGWPLAGGWAVGGMGGMQGWRGVAGSWRVDGTGGVVGLKVADVPWCRWIWAVGGSPREHMPDTVSLASYASHCFFARSQYLHGTVHSPSCWTGWCRTAPACRSGRC